MTEPEAVWVFPEKRRRRAWPIVVGIVAALVVAGVLVFALLPRAGSPAPVPSASPSASATASLSPTPSPTPSASEPPSPTPSPTVTESSAAPSPPPVTPPDTTAFAAAVRPVLDSAVTGLGFLDAATDAEAAAIVETLQDDAARLHEQLPPAAIANTWSAALDDYTGALSELHNAYTRDSDPIPALTEARATVEALRAIVGL